MCSTSITLQAGPDDRPDPLLLQMASDVILRGGWVALAGGACDSTRRRSEETTGSSGV
ncbi:MAG: hypothetical protein KatS3mg052_1264 [Candidatus Roseilinea sp.]|nr:MAG: hypothetical protein KatS3mg052_1264 [Candidatus Roseilinea sp.]